MVSWCSRGHPGALWLSKTERRQYGLQLFGFLRHVLLGFSILLADYSIFWLLDLFRHQLSAEIIARGEQHPWVLHWLRVRAVGWPQV